MKMIMLAGLMVLALSAMAQQKEAKQDTATVAVTVPLTAWQQKQLNDYELQKKIVDEQIKLLFKAILDFNKIDDSKVQKVDMKPNGDLVLKVKK